MKVTPETLDKLSSQIKISDAAMKVVNTEYSKKENELSFFMENSSYATVIKLCIKDKNGYSLLGDKIISLSNKLNLSIERKIEIVELIKSKMLEQAEEDLKKAKQQFKQELLGED